MGYVCAVVARFAPVTVFPSPKAQVYVYGVTPPVTLLTKEICWFITGDDGVQEKDTTKAGGGGEEIIIALFVCPEEASESMTVRITVYVAAVEYV